MAAPQPTEQHRYPQPQLQPHGGGSGEYPTVAGSPTMVPDTERELDELRSRVFPAAVSHLVLGLVGLPFCWVGYGFVVVLSILLIVVGSIGVSHLSSMAQLRFSTCCCFPLNTVRQLHTWYVVTCIFALLASVTCLINLLVVESHTVRIFAAIGMTIAVVSICVLIYGT